MPDSNKHYPLSIETVKKIKAQNKSGIRPEELETAEVSTGKPKEVEPEYADLVGQISLKTLEKTTRKRRDKERSLQAKNNPRSGQGHPSNRQQGNRPQNRPPQSSTTRGPQHGSSRPKSNPPNNKNQSGGK